jgi:probable addiction module antidote protein
MALDTELWDIADHLKDRDAIFYYLEAQLEEADALYAARALADVIRVRGGLEKLSAESGIPADALEKSRLDESRVDYELLTKLMEAFRPPAEKPAARVA